MKNAILPFCFLLALVSNSCKNKSESDIEESSKVIVLYWGDERIFFQDYSGMEASFMMFLPLAKEAGNWAGGKPIGMLANKFNSFLYYQILENGIITYWVKHREIVQNIKIEYRMILF